MLPQPFLTTAQMKQEGINMVLDLNEEWAKLQENEENPSALLTGVMVVRTEYAEQNPEAVAAFMDSYAASVEYVNTNTDEAAKLIAGFDIVPEPVAKLALPYCKIVYFEGAEMKDMLSGYLQVLFDQNPQAVGGTLPTDAFYYGR
jgi:NitT/TauT family transport system substrate-binding protein